MASTLSRKVPLAELHCHLGAAVTPAIMWSIAHAQGIKLPTRDYWEFRDLITVHRDRPKSFDGYLQLFHWTELIQSSPIAVERAVYEVVGGAYRKNNVTTMELRFNPMKRNRGGPSPPTLRVPAFGGLSRGPRRYGMGITIHTGESGPVEEIARVIELLEPDRIGHGVKAAYDPRAMDMLRERGIVLEICPTSNLNTGVVSGWDEMRWIIDQFRRTGVRFVISTDGPEMLRTYIRDELATLARLGILSPEEVQQVAATSLAASFVRNVTDVPQARRAPAPREVVEREEA